MFHFKEISNAWKAAVPGRHPMKDTTKAPAKTIYYKRRGNGHLRIACVLNSLPIPDTQQVKETQDELRRGVQELTDVLGTRH